MPRAMHTLLRPYGTFGTYAAHGPREASTRGLRRAFTLAFGGGLVGLIAACSSCSSDDVNDGSSAAPNTGTGGPDGSEGSDGGMKSDGQSDGSGSDGSATTGTLFGFVGSNDGKVRVYTVDAGTGAWTAKRESAAGTSPSFLAFDPPRGRIFAVDESQNRVRAFAFDAATTALSPLNDVGSEGGGPTHLAFDPTAAWVTVANYGGGTMAIFPVGSDGRLGAPADTKNSGEKSHWAGTDPAGTHVFVAALGANHVAQYVLDRTSGKLTDNGVVALPAGAGPRHVVFAPDAKHAWVINELAITVTSCDYDAATGKLTTKQTISALPDGTSKTGVSGAEIAVHPTGKWVYASTRGFNSIAAFTIGADGTLTRTANETTGGDQPRSFGMDPEGTLIFAGNEKANVVVGFRIDPSTGALTPLGKTVDVTGPTFVGLARFPTK